MYCSNCGVKIVENASYCWNCGSPVIKPQDIQQQPEGQSQQYGQQPDNQSQQYGQQPDNQPQQYRQQPEGQPQQYRQQSDNQPQQYQRQPGLQPEVNNQAIPPYGNQQPYGQRSYEQQPYEPQPYGPQTFGQYRQPAQNAVLGMNWYKFLIYFDLPLGFISRILYAPVIMTGSLYLLMYTNGNAIYSYYPSLKMVDVFFGFFQFCLAALTIVTRQYLAERKLMGIHLLYGLIITVSVSGVIYKIICWNILGINVWDLFGLIIGLLINIAILGIDIIYFTKRKALFH